MLNRISVALLFLLALSPMVHKAFAQAAPCSGAACSDIAITRTSTPLMNARKSTQAAHIAQQDAVANALPLTTIGVPTQFTNNGTKAISISVNTLTNMTVGKPPVCADTTSAQLAPGQQLQVKGFVCSPYQASYVGQ